MACNYYLLLLVKWYGCLKIENYVVKNILPRKSGAEIEWEEFECWSTRSNKQVIVFLKGFPVLGSRFILSYKLKLKLIASKTGASIRPKEVVEQVRVCYRPIFIFDQKITCKGTKGSLGGVYFARCEKTGPHARSKRCWNNYDKVHEIR